MPMKRFAAPLALVLLSACSGGEAPHTAEFVQATPAEADFGNLRVRYNALPTLALSEPVAKQYGVARDAGTALVLVALREVKGNEESDADGDVSVTAHDLSGARQAITLRKVEAGGYTDYIGTARVSPRNSYRFEIVVATGGRRETVKFQRNF